MALLSPRVLYASDPNFSFKKAAQVKTWSNDISRTLHLNIL